jgi:uncharacterized phage-associated protein
MSLSAHDVAAALRDRIPGLTVKKLHKLLYYCQGHHLATFGEPLFGETVSAWDMGPVVGELWYAEKRGQSPGRVAPLDQAALNTVGYVLSRYGALTGEDLEHLTHSEPPWRDADEHRPPGSSARIERDRMRDYFRSDGAAETPDLDPVALTGWLRDAPARLTTGVRADSPDEIRRRLGRVA